MTNRFLISAAALALIAGVDAANAQGTMNREGGAATPNAPSLQAAPSSSGAPATPNRDGTEPSGKMSPQSEQSAPGAVKNWQAEDSMPGQNSKGMGSDNAPRGSAKDMKAEEREGRDTNTNAQRTGERSQTAVGQASAGAKLSTEQRTMITTLIRNERVAPVNNVDFQISVGTRVPRERISLRPLPAEVITIYPEWRRYEFFLARDEIVVVDPRLLAIVAVLPA